MITLLVLIPAIIFIAVILLIARYNQRHSTTSGKSEKAVAFHWRYIAVPSILFLISIILVAVFYSRLSANVAWHFGIDGTPDRWLSKNAFTAGVLAIQLVLLLVGLAVVFTSSRTIGDKQAGELIIRPESMLTFMGNLPAVIQLIVGFMMIDYFSYNVSQKHLMPLWLFLVIILVLATLALIIFFVVVAVKMNRMGTPGDHDKSTRENDQDTKDKLQ